LHFFVSVFPYTTLFRSVSGMFVGLLLGGLLGPINWRLVFLISVPVGLFGTVWAYLKLEERSEPVRRPVDWWGNALFAGGLVCLIDRKSTRLNSSHLVIS